jgi:hypothetical protein
MRRTAASNSAADVEAVAAALAEHTPPKVEKPHQDPGSASEALIMGLSAAALRKLNLFENVDQLTIDKIGYILSQIPSACRRVMRGRGQSR